MDIIWTVAVFLRHVTDSFNNTGRYFAHVCGRTRRLPSHVCLLCYGTSAARWCMFLVVVPSRPFSPLSSPCRCSDIWYSGDYLLKDFFTMSILNCAAMHNKLQFKSVYFVCPYTYSDPLVCMVCNDNTNKLYLYSTFYKHSLQRAWQNKAEGSRTNILV